MNHEARKVKTVAVALSGGADSLYSLLDLRERGYEVLALHGIFLTAENVKADAAALAARERLAGICAGLGLTLHVVDLREAFMRMVITPFVRGYGYGLTPNPCALCNASVKFGLLQDEALRLGASHMATGHYASLSFCAPGRDGREDHLPALCQGADPAKDQSYFLGLVPRERFGRALFPLGAACKKDVLASLERRGITVPQPGESQDVCFIPDDDYRAFVPRMAARLGLTLPGPGPVLLADGTRLGVHQGLWRYTEGQRKGLGIAWKEPLYVIEKERKGEVLRLGPKVELLAAGCECDEVNYLLPFDCWPQSVLVKTRYREQPQKAVAEPMQNGGLRIRFVSAGSAVAAGQIAALYAGFAPEGERGESCDKESLRLLAGGVISRGLA